MKGRKIKYCSCYVDDEEEEEDNKLPRVTSCEKNLIEICEMYGPAYEDLFESTFKLCEIGDTEPFQNNFKTYPFTFLSLQEIDRTTILTYWGVNKYAPTYNSSYLSMEYSTGFTSTSYHHSIVIYGKLGNVDGEKIISGGLTNSYFYSKSIRGDDELIFRFYDKSFMFKYSLINPRPLSVLFNDYQQFTLRIKKISDIAISITQEIKDDNCEKQSESRKIEGVFHEDNFDKFYEIGKALCLIDWKSNNVITFDRKEFEVERLSLPDDVANIFQSSRGLFILTKKYSILSISLGMDSFKPKLTNLNLKLDLPDLEPTCSVMNSRLYKFIESNEKTAFRYFANGKFFELDLVEKKTIELKDINTNLENCMFFCWNATANEIYYMVNNRLYAFSNTSQEYYLDLTKEDFDPMVMDIIPSRDYVFFYYYDESYKTLYITTIENQKDKLSHTNHSELMEVINIDAYKFKERIPASVLENSIQCENDAIFASINEETILICPQFQRYGNHSWETNLSILSYDVDLLLSPSKNYEKRDEKEASEIKDNIKTMQTDLEKLENEIIMSIARRYEEDKKIKDMIARGEKIEFPKTDKNTSQSLANVAMQKKLKKLMSRNLEHNESAWEKNSRKMESTFEEKQLHEELSITFKNL